MRRFGYRLRSMKDSPPVPEATGPSSRLGAAGARLRGLWRETEPRSRAWTGASWGLALAVCWSLGIRSFDVFSGWVTALALVVAVAYGLLRALAAGLFVLVVARLLAASPWRYRILLGGGFYLLSWEVFTGSLMERLAPTIFLVGCATIAGAALGVVTRRRTAETSGPRRLLAFAALACSVGAAALGLRWLFGAGNDDPPAIDAAARSRAPITELDLPDPGSPGDLSLIHI